MELNPFSYSFQEDPYPTYKTLRDETPLYHNEELGFWALSRYCDVVAASVDHGTYSSAKGTLLADMEPEFLEAYPMMIFMDPPRQTVLRKLIFKAFTPKRVSGLEPRIRELAVEILEPLVERGACDLLKEFAAVLPIEVVGELLGVPMEDRAMLRECTDEALKRYPDSLDIPPEALAASMKQIDYMTRLVAERRKRPGEDLISDLINAEVEREDGSRTRLTEPEIIGFANLLTGGGNETVTKALGNVIVLLARHPDSRRALVENPSLIQGAVDEANRYWPPSQYQGRSLTCEVELYGETVPAGARMLLLTGSACRDEREYDNADTFDIHRHVPLSLAFGHGAHKCLGTGLAALEGRVCLEEILARIPDYQLNEQGIEYVHMTNVMGFASVPISY